jgi:hypothetical protein
MYMAHLRKFDEASGQIRTVAWLGLNNASNLSDAIAEASKIPLDEDAPLIAIFKDGLKEIYI